MKEKNIFYKPKRKKWLLMLIIFIMILMIVMLGQYWYQFLPFGWGMSNTSDTDVANTPITDNVVDKEIPQANLLSSVHPVIPDSSDNQPVSLVVSNVEIARHKIDHYKYFKSFAEKYKQLLWDTIFRDQEKDKYINDIVSGETTVACVNSKGILRSNPPALGMIALAFDDGPNKDWTKKYLDVLAEYDAHATFFLLGQYVNRYPDLAKQILENGHDVGSHSFKHNKLNINNVADIEKDFKITKEAFVNNLGLEPVFFRPPYGSFNDQLLKVAKENGCLTVMWSVDVRDWDAKNSDDIVKNILHDVKGGDILVLHEGKELTYHALPSIIVGLRDAGYQLVTVSDLLYETKK